jgi:hypothetical protein
MAVGGSSPGPLLRRIALAIALTALWAAASISPAGASVTIGQLAPGASPTAFCNFTGALDLLQPTVTSGNGYVVPALPGVNSLVISSWSTNASVGTGQVLTFKVFRPVSGTTYSVVAHDGPRQISPSTVNTFPGLSISVRPGDVIGFQHSGVPTACIFEAGAGEFHLERVGDLADGQAGAFGSDNQRVNATAIVGPDNRFSIGAVRHNKARGIATITAVIPNPGELTVSGKGVKGATASAGTAKLTIRAKGKKRRTLDRTGKVKLKPLVTYTPTGGDPRSLALKVKLKKR